MALPANPIELRVDPGNNENAPHTEGDTLRFSNSAMKQFLNDFTWYDTRHGPYQYGGKLWGVFVDTISNHVEVWSTVNASVWAEADPTGHKATGANAPNPGIFDKDIGFPPTFRNEFGWENFAVAADLTANQGVLFVAFINPEYKLAYAEFNLETEQWGPTKVGPDPVQASTEFWMRPAMGLEYRPSNDDCLLIWARSLGNHSAIAGIPINRTSGFGAEFGVAGNTSAAILHGTLIDEDDRVHVWWRGPSTDRGIFVVSIEPSNSPNASQKIVDIQSESSTHLIFGGSGIRRIDGTLVIGYWRRRSEVFQPVEFRIGALTAPSAAVPSWTDTVVRDWSSSSAFYPVPGEDSTENLFMFFYASPSGGGTASEIAYSQKGVNWTAEQTLVDLTNAVDGEPFWDGISVQPQAGIVTGNPTMAMFFDRGIASYDPDQIQDERGPRYDFALPPWYWGEGAGLALSLYTINGPRNPRVVIS